MSVIGVLVSMSINSMTDFIATSLHKTNYRKAVRYHDNMSSVHMDGANVIRGHKETMSYSNS